jgi:hypothetical protein
MEAVFTFLKENKGTIEIFDGDLLPSYAIKVCNVQGHAAAGETPEPVK